MMKKMSVLKEYLDSEVGKGEFPGYCYGLFSSDAPIEVGFGGYSRFLPNCRFMYQDSIFDVASLTKPLITASSVMLASQMTLLSLDLSLGEIFPHCPSDKADCTILDLLSHRAGFRDWYPTYCFGSGRDSIVKTLMKLPLAYQKGTDARYSCLGYILLGVVFEKVTGKSLQSFSDEYFFRPLGLRNTGFCPPLEERKNIAATECGNFHEISMLREMGLKPPEMRRAVIIGQVHDGNAYAMGGISGNAGLFSTVNEIAQLARVHLGPIVNKRDEILSQKSVFFMTREQGRNDSERFGIGWQLFHERWSGGLSLSSSAFGHTGFTGCGLWIDPHIDRLFILLTNRVHPKVRESRIVQIRKNFISLALKHF